MLLYDAIEQYITLHLATTKKPYTCIALLRRYGPRLKNQPLEAVTRVDVLEWHRQIGKTVPGSANKLLKLLRHCYVIMGEWGKYTGPNPCDRLKLFPRPKQKRVVQPGAEMTRLREAIEADRQVEAQVAVSIAFFTGLRKMEICGLEWQHVDMRTGKGVYPNAKGGKPYKFTLPPEVLVKVNALPRTGRYLFQTRTGKAWTEGTINTAWYRIRARAGLDDVKFHDLRRTYASWLQKMGVPLYTIRDLLNHTNIQTTEIYLDGIDLSDQDAPIATALEKELRQGAPSHPAAPIAPASVTPLADADVPEQPSPSAWHYGGREGTA